jgi:hypothetical protein
VTIKQSEEEMYAFAQVLELLAGIKRESERLLHLAKKPNSTVEDLADESDKLYELAASYELAILEKGEFDEQE